MKFLFVINPSAGNEKSADVLMEIREKMVRTSFDFKFLETTGSDDTTAVLNQLTIYKPTCVVACGGDGTIQLVARNLIGKKIPMVILPVGSANGLATALEIPSDLDEAFRVFTHNTKKIPLDLLQINDHICTHLSDLGTNALLVKNYEDAGDKGMLGYAKHLVSSIKESEIMHYQIETSAGITTGEGYMLIIANAHKYGTGVHISVGSVSDGKFEICPVREIDLEAAIKVGLTALNVFVDKDMFSEVITTTSAEIKINRKVHLQVDGEYIGETDHVKVSLIPSALHILVPE